MAKKTISNTFTVNTIEDGTSPYLLNLTNETDSIACDDQGTPYLMNGQRQTASTNFNFFVGNSRVRPTRVTVEYNGQRLTSGVMMDGFLATWTTSGITIEFYQSYQTEGETVTVKYDGTPLKFDIIGVLPQQSGDVSVIAAATFAVVPVKGTALYRIIPSTDQIVKHADNSYTPAGDTNITCSVTKTVGGVVSTPDPSEYTLKMIKDGGDEVGYQATQVDTITSKMEYILYVPAGGTRIMDRETIPLVLDGKNASTLDIDNEYDSVQTDSTGKILADKTIQTIVRLYKGSAEIDISGATITVTGMPASTIATFAQSAEGNDGKGRKLSWAFIANQTMSDKYNIAITYTYSGTEYKATFTINASKGQAVFNLKPSYSALPCTRNASTGALNNPPALSLQVEVTDTNKHIVLSSFDNNGAVTYNNTQYYVRYSTSSMPTAGNAGTKWPSGNSVQASTTNSNVYIAIFTTNNSSGVLLDRETVPIVKDAHEINPNILLDTAEYKTGVYSSSNPNGKWFNLNGVNDGNYEGRVARYVDTSNTSREGSSPYYRRVAEQQVAATSSSNNKLDADTWYTLSAYFKGSGTGSLLMLQAGGYIDSTFYIDGTEMSGSSGYTSGDLSYTFTLSGAWTRHTLTFKTKDSMSSSNTLYASARLLNNSGYVYVSMMKLEKGEVATAYLPNEEDLRGEDGEDGANASYIQVNPTTILYQADKNGNASEAQSFSMTYYLKVNGKNCDVSSASNVSISCPSNVSVSSKTTSSCTISVANGTSPSGSITLTMTGTYNSKSYTATTYISVAAVKAGADGSRGRTGRAFYYAGEFDSSDETTRFVVNNAQAPYFSHGTNAASGLPNCHVYNPSGDVNASLTMSQMWANSDYSWNNAPWEDFNSQYKYLMSQVVFSESGYFGAAIVNKDWIYTKHGKVYLAFDENTSITSTDSDVTKGTRISVFYPKVSGTHKFHINYTTNGGTLNYRLVNRSTTPVSVVFSGTQTSGSWVEHSVYLTASFDYIIEAYKPSSDTNTPIINSVTMDSPVPDEQNYLFFDAYTTWGRKSLIATYGSDINYNGTVVIDNMSLSSGLQYRFFVEYKGDGIRAYKLDVQNSSGSWVTVQDNSLSGWSSSTDYTESFFNVGIANIYGSSSYKKIFRLTLFNNSNSTTIVKDVSITSGQMFAPNWSVDLLYGTSTSNKVCVRGSVYADSGVFNGTVYAKDGEFSGTVKARLFYAKTCYVSGNYTINLETEPYYTYRSSNYSSQGAGQITLPNPSMYDGVELRFYCYFPTRSSAGTNIYYSGGIWTTTSSGFLSLYQTLSLKKNRFATVKAMSGYWYVVDDGVETPDASAPSIDIDDPEIDEQV